MTIFYINGPTWKRIKMTPAMLKAYREFNRKVASLYARHARRIPNGWAGIPPA